jgi:hypothetical protein
MDEEKLKENLENKIKINGNGKFNEESMKANYLLARLYLKEDTEYGIEKAKECICESINQFKKQKNPIKKKEQERNKVLTYLNNTIALMNTIKAIDLLTKTGMRDYFTNEEIPKLDYEELKDIVTNTPRKTYTNVGREFEKIFGEKAYNNMNK